ncbi:hypothetical protein OK016_26830 [Vibrio chagasii]|nr:hypothetical protein [Vibrio chagasii]
MLAVQSSIPEKITPTEAAQFMNSVQELREQRMGVALLESMLVTTLIHLQKRDQRFFWCLFLLGLKRQV